VSRVGKNPIPIPEKVTVQVNKNYVTVKGPKGQLEQKIDPSIQVKIENNTVILQRSADNRPQRAFHGLYRSLIANMVAGVEHGFSKKLEIVGVGYRADMKGKTLVLQLGFAHPIILHPPKEISITVETPTNLTVVGISKELVGLVAAKIRSFKPPEPYKGKGIHYLGETIRRKAGKSAGG